MSSVRPNFANTMLEAGFLGNLISILHQLSRPKCTRKSSRKNLPPTKRACGQVGDLKLVRPNVCRYKLLMFNYLQMFGSFRPTEQKYKRIPKVQLLPSAPTCHNTMLAAVFIALSNPFGLNKFLCYEQNICQTLLRIFLRTGHKLKIQIFLLLRP